MPLVSSTATYESTKHIVTVVRYIQKAANAFGLEVSKFIPAPDGETGYTFNGIAGEWIRVVTGNPAVDMATLDPDDYFGSALVAGYTELDKGDFETAVTALGLEDWAINRLKQMATQNGITLSV